MVGWLDELWGPLVAVGAVHATFGVLDLRDVTEMVMAEAGARALAGYALAMALVGGAIVARATLRHRRPDPALRGRIRRSLRLVLGPAALGLLGAAVLEELLGRGAIHRWWTRGLGAGAITIAIVLLYAWRRDLASAYLDSFPDGRLVPRVRRSSGRPPGLVVTAFVLVAVAGRWVRLEIGEVLSSFRATRRALAFLFRRQAERAAEAAADETTWEQLPAEIRQAFEDRPATDPWIFPHFPHLDDVADRVDPGSSAEAGIARVLVGARGVGKTSWLDELARRRELGDGDRLELGRGCRDTTNLLATLGSAFGPGPDADADAIVEHLGSGPSRVILLDRCEALVLRTVGGLDAFRTFARIVGQTSDRIEWICAFTDHAWEYVSHAFPTGTVFRSVHRLGPWSESQIHRLIVRRMDRLGCTPRYEDLVGDRLAGGERLAEIQRTTERFHHLLWDYADGLPRVALHWWLRSLAPDGEGRVRVRVFAAPTADRLEGLDERARFTLAAVVRHGVLTPDEAARVLNRSPGGCRLAFRSLLGRGVLVEVEDEACTVPLAWDRAATRYLRRKHLLHGGTT